MPDSRRTIVGVVFAVLFCLIIVGFIAMIMYRRHKTNAYTNSRKVSVHIRDRKKPKGSTEFI